MSAYLVDPEHIHVLLHAAVYRWPGQVELSWPTEEVPSAVNAVEDRHWATVRRLTSSTMDVIGQLFVDANAASVNYRYGEDNAYIYAWQQPKHTDWSPVELLSAIAGHEYQACEIPDWATSGAHEFCARLRQVNDLQFMTDRAGGDVTIVKPVLAPGQKLRIHLPARYSGVINGQQRSRIHVLVGGSDVIGRLVDWT